MKLDTAMWKKALNIIPDVSKSEWDALDVVSRWLISTRAAVLIMTFLSASLAGLFALRSFSAGAGAGIQPGALFSWLVLALGLVMAHAANNIFNDFTDYVRGVDKDNYFRTIYGAQPIASGLMTRGQHLTYFAVTALAALVCGVYLLASAKPAWDPNIWILLGLGAFFVLFYTWPLKYIALGEVAVIMVWGPLMIGGGYYVLMGPTYAAEVITVSLASLPYVLGVTTVIFGKHIDKGAGDKSKHIYTLPVLIGEKASRYAIMAMFVLPYLITLYLVAIHFFTPVMVIIAFALPTLFASLPPLTKPKPATRPEGFPDGQGGWPLYFAPIAFGNNRAFGVWFVFGVILDVAVRFIPATAALVQQYWHP